MKAPATKLGGVAVVAPSLGDFFELQEAVGMKLAGISYGRDGRTPARLVFIAKNKKTPSGIGEWVRTQDPQISATTEYAWA